MTLTGEWEALLSEYCARSGYDPATFCYCGSIEGLRETVAKMREQEVEPEA